MDGPIAGAFRHLVAVSLHQYAAPFPWCQPLAGFPYRLPRFGGLCNRLGSRRRIASAHARRCSGAGRMPLVGEASNIGFDCVNEPMPPVSTGLLRTACGSSLAWVELLHSFFCFGKLLESFFTRYNSSMENFELPPILAHALSIEGTQRALAITLGVGEGAVSKWKKRLPERVARLLVQRYGRRKPPKRASDWRPK